MASNVYKIENRSNRAGAWGVMLALLAGGTLANAQSTSKPTVTPPADTVNVGDDMTVDLHVKDEDLSNVLEMLSIQSQKNIIASKDVQARVTANLYGVTFYEALDAILHVNGYGFIEEGNFVKVYTLDELAKIEHANRAKVSRIIPLNYLNAVDAAEFVKPLLSPEGQIKVNSKATPFTALADTPVGGEDYAHNSVMVIYDYEENVQQVLEMVRQIDTRPAQVLVEATILQTQVNEANALGVDFSVLADVTFNDFVTGPLSAAQSIITGVSGPNQVPTDAGATAVTSSVGSTASGSGGLKIGIISNDVGVFLRALDEVTDTTVISNPKIMTLNRQPSRVLVGRKVGYLSTTATDTSTTQSVEFLDTGTQLYFRPFVTNDGLIRMELKPAVSEAAIRTINDVSGAAVTIPDEITNELTTNVLVRDGQTIILGGLFREKVESSRKQVPVLGDIPFIGAAFRGNSDDMNRNEIIFLITPTILNDTLMTDAGNRAKNSIDSIVYGARSGMLFFSRDKQTNQLNIDADRALRSGKEKKALNLIERSLELNPRQPELIKMRERVTGTISPMTNRSFLDKVIDREADDHLLHTKIDNISTQSSNTTSNWQPDAQSAQAPQMFFTPQTKSATTSSGNTPRIEASASTQDNIFDADFSQTDNMSEQSWSNDSSTTPVVVEPVIDERSFEQSQWNSQPQTPAPQSSTPQASTGWNSESFNTNTTTQRVPKITASSSTQNNAIGSEQTRVPIIETSASEQWMSGTPAVEVSSTQQNAVQTQPSASATPVTGNMSSFYMFQARQRKLQQQQQQQQNQAFSSAPEDR